MQGSGLGPDYGWTRRSETTAKLRSATSDVHVRTNTVNRELQVQHVFDWKRKYMY